MLDIDVVLFYGRDGGEAHEQHQPTRTLETSDWSILDGGGYFPLFQAADPFFYALDKVQVKYEMLRAHFCDGDTVTAAARSHGYSRAEFYLVAARSTKPG